MTSAVNTSIDQMLPGLTTAGWRKKLTHVWISPTGKLYLGPAGAWKVMRGLSAGTEVDTYGRLLVSCKT